MDWMTIGIMDLVFMIVASERVPTVVGAKRAIAKGGVCGVDASSFSEPAGEAPANQSLW